ncbi:MAG TPA: WD40 repeat domain-containing serine/threonine protein kinase [Thermoanaerobaculia bacterium]|jgi:hypothetical protein
MTATLLANSRRLGPYQIIELLGAGGMGEVYRAVDSRLQRSVAVKVLPRDCAKDSELLKRLEREARAIGQLNHPNVVAVYDVGSEDGVEYIVMELLEGETLGTKLRDGRLPLRKALEYATQIARGLAAAHEKNIVHRDLKPDNVFITRDGRVKILDFGLAHQLRGEHELGQGSSRLTLPGMVVGTVAYMSPEQARGQVVDRRTDIFSFGVVLYEMLSGKTPFEEGTAFETMTAIINNEAADLMESVPNLPPLLYRIVAHCLEKSPAARFQTADDLAFDLEACAEIPWGAPSGALPLPARTRQRTVMAIAAAVAAVVVSAAALIVYREMRRTPLTELSFHRLTFKPSLIQSARFTADGETVVYSGSTGGKPLRVQMLRTDRPESQALAIPNGDLAAVSRTGEMAVILNARLFDWSGGGVLAQVPILGGTPREVVDGVMRADWSPDGRLAVWRRTEKGLQQLEFPLGNVLYSSEQQTVFALRVSPQGDKIAIDISSTDGMKTDIVVFGLDGSRRTLTSTDVFVRGLAWTPNGKEVWFSTPRNADQLWSIYGVTLDGKERLILRTPSWPWLYDIARDGTVLLGLATFQGGIMVPNEKGGEHDLSWLDASALADVASDGKAILFTEWNTGVKYKATVFMRSTDESSAVRLGEGIAVAFSPRGDRVLALRSGPKRRELILLPTGIGKTETLANDLDCLWAGFLPDGRIVITAQTSQGPRMFIQAADGTPPRALTPPGTAIGTILPTGAGAIKPISPDGQSLLVFDRNQRAWIVPLGSSPQSESPALRPAAGVLAGEVPAGWSRDGRHVYVYHPVQMPMNVYDVDLASGERRLLREVSAPDPEGVFRISPVLLMPDGHSFAYGFYRQISVLYTASGLR